MNSINDYFKALGVTEKGSDLDFVSSLISSHLSKFAFTSIPVLLKDSISLELPDIITKLVISRRGGYCFEHNKLMYEALKSLNFSVTPLLARVIHNRLTLPPETHRITLLSYQGNSYIVDVGNSYLSPALLVNLAGSEVTSVHGRTYKVSETAPNTFQLQQIKDDKVFILYQFDLQKCYEVDFELSHFYSSHHPDATFVNNLVISKIFPDAIRSLRNANYQIIHNDSTGETSIDSLKQFTSILLDEFNYPITPDEAEFLYNKFIKSE